MIRMITRRDYLMVATLRGGTHVLLASEAVATTIMAHPEIDWLEERPWEGWAADGELDPRVGTDHSQGP